MIFMEGYLLPQKTTGVAFNQVILALFIAIMSRKQPQSHACAWTLWRSHKSGLCIQDIRNEKKCNGYFPSIILFGGAGAQDQDED
ncbi:MAG: hypothetical protein ABSF38_18215 [Verrucomicrobiota bacterium]